MKIFVVGAGIVGSMIARELSKYDVELHIIEKKPDIAWGVTKANSAILHSGYDDPVGSIRAKFCSRGNLLYTDISKELDVEIKRLGSYVVAFSEKEIKTLERLKKQGEINGVTKLEIIERSELLSREPNLNPNVKAALWAPTAGIIEPWEMAIAAIENSAMNGAILHLNEEVVDIEVKNKKLKKLVTDKGEYEADVVINAAGLFADEIANMTGAEPAFKIFPRKGEYILLDKKLGTLVNSIIFPIPTEKSKGILVLPTVDGGLLIGPNAQDLPRNKKHDLTTTMEGLEEVKKGALELVPKIDLWYSVKAFSGLRPETKEKDFIVGRTNIWGFVNAAGMRSPGLTAAPAVAEYIVEEVLIEKLKIPLLKKKDFNPFRKKIPHIDDYKIEEWDKLIKTNPKFGNLVCFCNKVSEAEIVEAIKRGARTVDGIKFRTRAGFGRCQSGFCGLKIMEILSRELNVPMEEIKMNSENSWIMNGKVRI
ncbi:MAG: NAD(P)/FAD-dependent oxidoreductase [Thermotogae bacterium]|nr:NAD(P)/FAD-dependent oxidoreductase [Thermotogota bacterium]